MWVGNFCAIRKIKSFSPNCLRQLRTGRTNSFSFLVHGLVMLRTPSIINGYDSISLCTHNLEYVFHTLVSYLFVP